MSFSEGFSRHLSYQVRIRKHPVKMNRQEVLTEVWKLKCLSSKNILPAPSSRKHNALCIPKWTLPASSPVEQSEITQCKLKCLVKIFSRLPRKQRRIKHWAIIADFQKIQYTQGDISRNFSCRAIRHLETKMPSKNILPARLPRNREQ